MENENYYHESNNLPMGFKMLQFYYKNIGALFPKLSGLIFWKVFCLPKKRTIREKHQRFLNSAAVETIGFDNIQIQSYHWGTGKKKILIVHGWEGMSADFNMVISKLVNDEHSVMAVDLPAHGKSTGKRTHIPMIMRLIEKLIEEYGPFHGIVSHSLGAAASALTLAKLNGTSKLSKMVLMGLHPFPFVFFEQFRQALKINDDLYNKCLEYVESKINLKLEDFSVPDVKHLISVDKILLVHDDFDTVVNIKKIKDLNKEWDSSELFSGNHGGHFKHYKHPEVVQKIADFMVNS